MSSKQARLIAAVQDAREAQGITITELSRAAGTSQSMISLALGGKSGMSEQKWRMVCEKLNIDYDEVVADLEEPAAPEPVMPKHVPLILPVPVTAREVEPEPTAEPEQLQEAAPEETSAAEPVADEATRHRCEVLGRYLAQNIKRDLEAGTTMSLDDIWTLLDTMRLLMQGGAAV